MKSILSFYVIVLLLSIGSSREFLPVAVKAAKVKSAQMWVENDKVHQGETIVLRFWPPNPAYLGIIDPEGKFFYLVFDASQSVGELTPLMDSKAFALADSLVLATASLTADPYKYGILEKKAVFMKSGTYTFILGDELHQDDESNISTLTVQYSRLSKGAVQARTE